MAFAAAAWHNYFFQPPLYEFAFSSRSQIFELLLFLVIATFLNQVSSQLRKALAIANEATRSREELLGIVSHELKNYLYAAQLHLDAAKENNEELNPSCPVKNLENISFAIDRGMHLIRQLLNMEKIRNGQLKLSLKPKLIPIAPFLESVRSMMLPQATHKCQKLEITTPDSAIICCCDRELLFQVLTNLVGNAIKFTENGGSVQIGCRQIEQNIQFTVTDNGPGISKKEISRIFEKFWQKPGSSARQGLGLGLAIVKGNIEAHGGRVWVESIENIGSTFFFIIPQ